MDLDGIIEAEMFRLDPDCGDPMDVGVRMVLRGGGMGVIVEPEHTYSNVVDPWVNPSAFDIVEELTKMCEKVRNESKPANYQIRTPWEMSVALHSSIQNVVVSGTITFEDTAKCECGSATCGSAAHSDWCPAK